MNVSSNSSSPILMSRSAVDFASMFILKLQCPAYLLSIVLSSIDILASLTTLFGVVIFKIGSQALRIYFSSQLICDAIAMSLNIMLNFYHFFNFLAGKPETMLYRAKKPKPRPTNSQCLKCIDFSDYYEKRREKLVITLQNNLPKSRSRQRSCNFVLHALFDFLKNSDARKLIFRIFQSKTL